MPILRTHPWLLLREKATDGTVFLKDETGLSVGASDVMNKLRLPKPCTRCASIARAACWGRATANSPASFTERDVLMKVVGTKIDLERTPPLNLAASGAI
jgi:hypothetical protein